MKRSTNESTLSRAASAVEIEMAALAALTDEQKQHKLGQAQQLIHHYLALSDKVEDGRIEMHNFALQLLAWSIAGAGVLATLKQPVAETLLHWFYRFAVYELTLTAFFSLLAVVWYVIQNRYHYPFLATALRPHVSQWRWFYHGNPDVGNMKRSPLRDGRKDSPSQEAFLKGLQFFAKMTLDSTLSSELRESIQYAYMLQVHNYYKNKFHLQLTGIWAWWCALTIINLMGHIVSALL